ncbi:sialidase family protein [Sphingobacterium arenae]|uniref:Exo-alpha-sialidase n=1 Tax=Sphingobacterium arenae TaxID=1280598 RepID=A0ABR7XZ04_9SPHI|nr:sialidase family protein [Sphingobacterium arenae]MBD1424267.1 exo-alpha-sialidase [Sphingobacterium arenae]
MKNYFKKLTLLFVIGCALGSAGSAQEFNIPELATVGQNGVVSAQFIYELDEKPTAQCHASTIIETSHGLMCAFFAGTHEKNNDVGIRVSHFNDGKWSWPVEVTNGFLSDSVKHPAWNPVLFRPKNGPIILFYKVGPDVDNWWGVYTTSTDEGRTWTKPMTMGKNEIVGDLLGPVKNKAVQLADGTIISPTSLERRGTPNGRDWRIYFEISYDNGKSWKVIPPINDGITYDAIQPSVLIHKNGDLQIIARTMQDVLVTSWSKDSGKTWSKLEDTGLPNPNSGTDAVTLHDGRHLLVYNHTTKKGEEPKGRNMLNVAISKDGHAWDVVTTLENKPLQDGYSYPAVIQTSDGKVHITYTYGRRSIKHVEMDPTEI